MGRLTNIKPQLSAAPPRLKPPPKIADSFYLSKEWKDLAAQVKRERGNRCERCGSTKRVIADHIKEIRDGGEPLSKANIELLCFTDHQRKTAQARARRARGQTHG